MKTQSKALQLADELDGTVKTGYWEAAAELSRLHSVNDGLLQALKDTLDNMMEWGAMASLYEQEKYALQADINMAKAAIAKAQEKT